MLYCYCISKLESWAVTWICYQELFWNGFWLFGRLTVTSYTCLCHPCMDCFIPPSPPSSPSLSSPSPQFQHYHHNHGHQDPPLPPMPPSPLSSWLLVLFTEYMYWPVCLHPTMPTTHLVCLSLHDNISFKGNQRPKRQKIWHVVWIWIFMVLPEQ